MNFNINNMNSSTSSNGGGFEEEMLTDFLTTHQQLDTGSVIMRIRPQLIGTTTAQRRRNSNNPTNLHTSNNPTNFNHSNINFGTVVHPRALSPNSPLRNKIVYVLSCSSCYTLLCTRAMRAILLADTKVELYSTDIPPERVYAMQADSLTSGCQCRVRETACTGCGNSVGYQVSQPCDGCLTAKNNGHFWMFNSEAVSSQERKDPIGNGKPLYWAALTPMAENLPVILSYGPLDPKMPFR